jgi:hypothetical protein
MRHLTNGETSCLEHRYVMAQMLGRALFADESVHHKNGDRLDNRRTNLELWSRWQPRGQRTEDKVTWAVELLRRYSPHLLSNIVATWRALTEQSRRCRRDNRQMCTGRKQLSVSGRPLLILALSVSALTAGCGSGSTGTGGPKTTLPMRLAPALVAARSFRITVDGTEHAPNQARATLHAEGVIDSTTGNLDMQIIRGDGGSSRLIVINRTVYLSGIGSVGAIPVPRGEWLVTREGKHDILGGLDPLGNPLTTLSSLRDRLTDVTFKGTTRLDGVPTSEFSGHLPSRRFASGVATVSVWVDQQDRVRRAHFVGAGSGASADITERLYDFGVRVRIVAPPASNVMSPEQLLNGP